MENPLYKVEIIFFRSKFGEILPPKKTLLHSNYLHSLPTYQWYFTPLHRQPYLGGGGGWVRGFRGSITMVTQFCFIHNRVIIGISNGWYTS
jgi:hypothetical protein